MKTLKVPDMHCSKCAERITKALTAKSIACDIDLSAKTVQVEEDKVGAAKEALDDIGFSAQE